MADEGQPANVPYSIEASSTVGAGRRGYEPDPFIIADRLDIDARALGQGSDGDHYKIDSVVATGCTLADGRKCVNPRVIGRFLATKLRQVVPLDRRAARMAVEFSPDQMGIIRGLRARFRPTSTGYGRQCQTRSGRLLTAQKLDDVAVERAGDPPEQSPKRKGPHGHSTEVTHYV